jgi:hypothetical protein
VSKIVSFLAMWTQWRHHCFHSIALKVGFLTVSNSDGNQKLLHNITIQKICLWPITYAAPYLVQEPPAPDYQKHLLNLIEILVLRESCLSFNVAKSTWKLSWKLRNLLKITPILGWMMLERVGSSTHDCYIFWHSLSGKVILDQFT